MGDGCTPLRVVPHNVLGAVHLVRPRSVQPLGVPCPVCRAHFTRMCGELAVPLAQQVHQSHIWQTLGAQRLCCPLCLSVALLFSLGIFVVKILFHRNDILASEGDAEVQKTEEHSMLVLFFPGLSTRT